MFEAYIPIARQRCRHFGVMAAWFQPRYSDRYVPRGP
jgi:hypothetical protein